MITEALDLGLEPQVYVLSLVSGWVSISEEGYNARAEKLSPEQRSEIARKAAKARWDKKKRREEESS